jgi:hypothetical protein
MTQGEIDAAWSRQVAILAVDALMRAKIVASTDLERAIEIDTEEIIVRLSLEDRPNHDNWRYKSN